MGQRTGMALGLYLKRPSHVREKESGEVEPYRILRIMVCKDATAPSINSTCKLGL